MKKAFLLLLFVPFLFSCSSSEDERLIREKLSSLQDDAEWFWTKPPNYNNQLTCVYEWFQNGYVYSERCMTFTGRECMQDWFNDFPLDEIIVLNETPDNIVFSYRDEIHEVVLSNNGNTVQLIYNSNPDWQFIVDKITDAQLTQFTNWISQKQSCN